MDRRRTEVESSLALVPANVLEPMDTSSTEAESSLSLVPANVPVPECIVLPLGGDIAMTTPKQVFETGCEIMESSIPLSTFEVSAGNCEHPRCEYGGSSSNTYKCLYCSEVRHPYCSGTVLHAFVNKFRC